METNLIHEILLKHGARPDLLLWRNNTGQAWTGNNVLRIARAGTAHVVPGDIIISQAHPIKFGLTGSPDVLGIRQGGTFLGIETKSARGKASEAQCRFHSRARSLGAEIIVARSLADIEGL